MHHLVVDAGADARRKPVISLKARARADLISTPRRFWIRGPVAVTCPCAAWVDARRSAKRFMAQPNIRHAINSNRIDAGHDAACALARTAPKRCTIRSGAIAG